MIRPHKSFIMITALVITSSCQKVTRSHHVGQSRAHKDPIPNGQIVLVRQGGHRGAFILFNQTVTPETTDYKWYTRSDGEGVFNTSDPAVTFGVEKEAVKVNLSFCSVEWSANNLGMGWIYYSLFPSDKKLKPAYEICVTAETNIDDINANDPKWVYRGLPESKPHSP